MAIIKNVVQGIKGERATPEAQEAITYARKMMTGREPIGKDLRDCAKHAIQLLTTEASVFMRSRRILYREAAKIAKEYDVDVNSLDKIWKPSKIKRELQKLARA